jgi:SWI/SNF-related matrix-associated actin-dependent regulator 1 of chromatin subfamily A
VLCLTGTPITNRPAEYASQLDILGRIGDFGGRWGFYKRYCNAFRDRWGQWHLDGAANLPELNQKLRASCYVRRTKEEVMPELAPVESAVRLVAPDPKVMLEYRKAEEDIVEYAANRAAEIARELGKPAGHAAVRARFAAESNEHLVRMAALRRLAARSKMPAVEEMVEEMLESGRKVVLAAHHRDVVDDLASRFGGLKIQGQMSPEEVERAKRDFQELPAERAPVIVLSIMAAKEGHTLTAAQDVIFVEEPWTPADVDQVVARCHRMGQRGSVTAWHVLASGTIDEGVHGLVERKRDVVRAATDGDDPSSRDSGPIVAELLLGMLGTNP